MAAAAPSKARKAPSTKNMTIGTLMEHFRCEDACREYLESLRWPEGVQCPRCNESKCFPIKARNQYECSNEECGYHFSVTAGTKLNDSHLPLWKWFLAVFLMVHAKKGISARQLHRMLGGSYKTSWYLCHRIRAAMGVVNDQQGRLPGREPIEVDETWVGGRNIGEGKSARTEGKEIVIGAVERDGQVRLDVIPNFGKKTMQGWIKQKTSEETVAFFTDSHSSYVGLGDGDSKHATITHSRSEWVVGKVHTNTIEGVFSLLKRSILGSYHKLSSKHLPSYLDEIEFKYNNRSNPYLFRETLLALMGSDPMPYRDLVDANKE